MEKCSANMGGLSEQIDVHKRPSSIETWDSLSDSHSAIKCENSSGCGDRLAGNGARLERRMQSCPVDLMTDMSLVHGSVVRNRKYVPSPLTLMSTATEDFIESTLSVTSLVIQYYRLKTTHFVCQDTVSDSRRPEHPPIAVN
jgi:hypothetical protein